MSRVALVATATDVVPPAAEPVAELRLSTPACTSTAPVKVLLAVTTSVPVPSLVMPPDPDSVPDSVVVLLLVMSYVAIVFGCRRLLLLLYSFRPRYVRVRSPGCLVAV